jgi:hypothetical protein
MSLTDVLGGVATLAGFVYGFKTLVIDKDIPWTEELEKELDEGTIDDYRFSDKE